MIITLIKKTRLRRKNSYYSNKNIMYTLRIEEKDIIVEDCIYRLHNDKLHEVSIIGVFYGSGDYKLLSQLLDTPITIQWIWNDEVFAELRNVLLDKVEYHLKEDGVNFYGTFQEYAEDTGKLEDKK